MDPICPGFTLPRSFKPPGYGMRACGSFSGLLIAYQVLYSPGHGKRRYGLFWGLSWDSFHRSTKPFLGLSCVWGNSRALVRSKIRGNQTRILFASILVWRLVLGFVGAHRSRSELNVPYTVTRAHSLIGETFVMSGDYLGDFNSFF